MRWRPGSGIRINSFRQLCSIIKLISSKFRIRYYLNFIIYFIYMHMFSLPLLCHTTERILRRRMTDRIKCQAFIYYTYNNVLLLDLCTKWYWILRVLGTYLSTWDCTELSKIVELGFWCADWGPAHIARIYTAGLPRRRGHVTRYIRPMSTPL